MLPLPKGRGVYDIAYPDKNNYPYWERNFKSCKTCVSSCMLPAKGLENRAALARHCEETLDKGCYEELLCELLCVNNGDKPSSENYTLTPGKLFHTENHRISPCPWACCLAAAWNSKPVNWVTRLKAFLPSPAKKTTSRWYLSSQPHCSTPHPPPANKQH